MLHNPVVLSVLLLFLTAALSKRKKLSMVCLWMAVAVLFICGNERVVGMFSGALESRYQSPDLIPHADCVLVLGGGILSRIPPRSTVEVNEAGNRVLYAAHLYREGKAPLIICTGASPSGRLGERSEAADMAELLIMLGVPDEAIVTETKARNTHEHALNLCQFFATQHIKRVLLVTSAMHMPRSMAVFRRFCPEIEFVAAPTDFRSAGRVLVGWYDAFRAFIPTPRSLLDCSDAFHEYFGLAYYRLRGWL
jgi:uncharacterized SAM-binding protein YcdF (DUF218 family)